MTYDEFLRSCGVTRSDAARLGWIELSSVQTEALGEPFRRARSVLLEYRDMHGEETGFFRVRYLDLVTSWDGKQIRYAQRSGSGSHAYLPSVLPWAEIASNPEHRLILPEGEKKAACLAVRGVAAIAIGGVYSFYESRNSDRLVDPMEEFNWSKREVMICFDSDVKDNPQVLRAQMRLMEALTSHGAIPSAIQLPALPHMRKTGLDDFIVSEGMEAFQDLMTTAEQHDAAIKLWNMNTEYAMLMDSGRVINLNTSHLYATETLRLSVESNRFYIDQKQVKRKNGEVVPILTKEPLVPKWLAWEKRTQFKGMEYCPGEGRVTEDGYLNTWKGWNATPEPGTVQPWHDHMNHVFNGDRDLIHWFEQWCAYPIQHPGAKLFTYCLFWTPVEGIGKTTIAEALMRIYGKEGVHKINNSVEVTTEQLNSPFNAWRRSKQFICGDELAGGDKRVVGDKIRGYITQESVTINIKNQPTYVLKDRANYLLTSNLPDAVHVSQKDRRAFIREILGQKPPQEYFTRFYQWLNEGGNHYLMHYLLTLSLEGFDPRAPAPETQDKLDLVEASLSDCDLWLKQLADNPVEVLTRSGVFSDRAMGCDLWTPTQLLSMYAKSMPGGHTQMKASGFGVALKRVSFPKSIATKIGETTLKLVPIRNATRWARAEGYERSAHYLKWNPIRS